MFARAIRSKILVLLMITFVLFPSMAFAEVVIDDDFNDKIIYGPNIWNIKTGEYVVQVYSASNFNAALTALGFNPFSSAFTDDVKSYLSNSSTGGSFTEFANGFSNNNDGNGDFSVIGASFDSALMLNNQIYGSKFVWSSKYTGLLRQAAYDRVQEVLDGNTGGGSGGNDGAYEGNYQTPDTLTFTMSNFVSADRYKLYSYIYSSTPREPDEALNATFTVTLNDTVKERLNSTGQTYHYATYILYHNEKIYQNAGVSIYSYLSENAPVINGTDNIRFTGKYAEMQFNTSVVTTNGHNDLTVTNVKTMYQQNGGTTFRLTLPAYVIGAGVGAPVVPPTQWPEPEPTTPTEPPEVPDPTPTDPPSEPSTPNIGIPQLPNIGLTTEPVYQTPDLSAVLDAMAEHCQHLQQCMIECFDSYYSSITQYEKSLQENNKEFFRSWFRVMLDTIRDCFDDLSAYLQRLFTWLADQMDFTFTGGNFDDTSIVWWLKRIYSKLGSGTTVRPTDPVVDPTGIGDWLDQLIKNFVLDLLALGQDGLADIVEMFRQLITKFPFSIPWDIAAILGLFVATPEIPVIEIPQFALVGNGITQVGTYTISLEPYDGAMGVARGVENVLFACWLAFKMDFFKTLVTGVLGGDK